MDERTFRRQFRSLRSAHTPSKLINAGLKVHDRRYSLLSRITQDLHESTTGPLCVKNLRCFTADSYGGRTPPPQTLQVINPSLWVPRRTSWQRKRNCELELLEVLREERWEMVALGLIRGMHLTR